MRRYKISTEKAGSDYIVRSSVNGCSHLNKNKKECIDDLNYIRKALTKGSLYQHDAIILLIDTIARYLFVDAVNVVDDEKAARHE